MAQIEVDLSPEEVQEILIRHVKDTLSLTSRGYSYVFQWTPNSGVHVSVNTKPEGEKHIPHEARPFSDFIQKEDPHD